MRWISPVTAGDLQRLRGSHLSFFFRDIYLSHKFLCVTGLLLRTCLADQVRQRYPPNQPNVGSIAHRFGSGLNPELSPFGSATERSQ